MSTPNIPRSVLRPESLLCLLAALFQLQHWSLESHGLRLRGHTSDFVTTIPFEAWYSPFALAALLFAAAFWLARRFPEWGILPYVCFVSVLAAPLLVYKSVSVYRVTYYAGNPSFGLAGTQFARSLFKLLLLTISGAFVFGQMLYIVKLLTLIRKDKKANA